MSKKIVLSMGDTVAVGNWLSQQEQPLKGTRQELCEQIRADLGITASPSSITTLCKDLGLELVSRKPKARGSVSREHFLTLLNEVRMMADDIGYETSKEFDQMVEQLFNHQD